MREDGMRFPLDIVNEKGLHARASAKFVETVERFDARARVSRDGMEVSGDSIMGLMMLAAARGTSIDIVVDGTEAAALADALRTLVGGRFGEPN
jgi:phosphocarrier protein